MMSGVRGGIYSTAWFRVLVLLAQKVMPEIKEAHPNDDQATLLAKALSVAYWRREAEKKAEASDEPKSEPKRIASDE